VAVEADWPDAYRVNRYVRGQGTDTDADDALAGFKRFPTWMWRNSEVLEFVNWLRAYNDKTRAEMRAGLSS
jgi:erythromycin esterase-like protein